MERLAKKEFLLISAGLLEMTINVNKDLKQRRREKGSKCLLSTY